MKVSRQEEIIAVLWIIAAIMAFGNGYTSWGWVFAVKAALDVACTITFAFKEALIERKESS